MTVRLRAICVALIAVLAAGCSGGGSSPTPAGAGTNHRPKGSLRLTIHIPHRSPAPHGRHGRYVSPATTSMSLDVEGPTIVKQNVGLLPTSTGCSSSDTSTDCALTLTLAPGDYTATIDTFDAGNTKLSTAQAVPFTVTAGTSNPIALTLSGIPSKVVALPATLASVQNPAGGIDLLGTANRRLFVEALDADGNMIFGAGAPTFTVAKTAGNLLLTLTQPAATSPNSFFVKPPAAYSASTATLTMTASYSGQATDGCAQSGAVCTGTVNVGMREILAVGESTSNAVLLYELPQTTPFATISANVVQPEALTFDLNGNLFIGNCGTCVASGSDSVLEFAPPYNGSAAATISSGISNPVALTTDASGDLFVANKLANSVFFYAPPFTGNPASIAANGPVGLALDNSADLFIANQGSNTVTAFVPPYTGAAAVTIANGINTPLGLAFDPSGNLFVINQLPNTGALTEYATPISNGMNATNTIAAGINAPQSLAIAPATGNVHVPVTGAGSKVQVYDAPVFNGMNPSNTTSNGLSTPSVVVVDGAGEEFVANFGGNNVTAYTSNNYNGNPVLTIPNVTAPISLAILP